MELAAFPFGITNWVQVAPTEHAGEQGVARWRTAHFGPQQQRVRVRMVEYSPGYLADHWCHKGHALLCLNGELDTELEDGRRFTLRPGMSYQVGDNAEAHRSSTQVGVTLFIVD
ncbi:DHCW motif cupin fold protein [Pseudomonas sp. LS44]|uniref:DHCW motif cupin fold protein n=1 Tax=Pseudomonas sp. LS44 TaxID=1357074 RepID=UPI00215A9B95|nr:DHCW motif cupin fold protein [Pseudomonas sp. LS44]UVE16346.1 DHCW motif cupin fold protein [Pseudomonas sp. LS44]